MRAPASIYQQTVRTIFKKYGLDKIVSEPYKKLRMIGTSDITNITFNDTSAKLHTDSYKTWSHVNRISANEEEVISRLLNTIQSEDIFVDVGAHIGIYSCLVSSKIGSGGSVISVEPFPPNVEELNRNRSLNNHTFQIENIALSDSSGTVELGGSSNERGSSGNRISESGGYYTVETEVPDKFFSRLNIHPNIMKIDIEGAEQIVIDNMRATLGEGNCRDIFVELHDNKLPKFGGSSREVKDILSELGYTIDTINQRPGLTETIHAYL